MKISNAQSRQVRLVKRNAQAQQNLHRIECQIAFKNAEMSKLETKHLEIKGQLILEHRATVLSIQTELAELREQIDIQREYRRRIHAMNQGVLGSHWMNRRFVETGLERIQATDEAQAVFARELAEREQAVIQGEARLLAREQSLIGLYPSHDAVGDASRHEKIEGS
ncbi:hypothetical protein EDC01DRAFT_630707 [Geopyxis carbonaria]|nr:hypothetical protein EDC01DRAFT_630707 [Geopyxis carbonaria]